MPRAAVTVLAFAPVLFAAQLRAQDEAAFDQGYQRVHDLMQKEKWTDAKAAIDALLAANGNQLFVLAQQEAIVEDYRRCCFAIEVKAPKAQELISGELLSWSPATGRIKVRYLPSSMRDWQQRGEGERTALLHPTAFKGDYSVTVRCTFGHDQNLTLFYDVLGNASSAVVFGSGQDQVESLLRATTGFGLGAGTAAFEVVPEARCTVMLKVTAARLQLFVDDMKRPCREEPRPKGAFGQVALVPRDFDELVLEGTIEPSWFLRVTDSYLADQRAAFDREFAPPKRLPAWLFDPPPGTRTPPKFDAEYPQLAAARPEAIRPVLAASAKGDWAKVRAAVQKATVDLPEVLREFLLGLALLHGGAPEDALPHADKALALEPHFPWTHALRAQCLDALRRHRDAQTEYLLAIADDPGEARLYEQTVIDLLRLGQGSAARRLIKDAKVEHGLWEEMRPLDRLLTMLERGPQWPRRFRAESTNYEVVSDIDERTCQQACSILEESLVNLKAQFTWIKDDKVLGRFRVFLFSGQAGYEDYCKQILGAAPAHTAGLYSPVLKQLLIWNLPKREDMETTIRHERVHQFLDRALVDPPAWFDEGMAEYWQTARREKDRFTGGQLRPDHLATLHEGGLLPMLEEFVHENRDAFYANARLRYAQSWALVHFLRKGPPRYQKIFPALWEALRGGSSLRAAIDNGFAGVDWVQLDADFWSYVTTVK